MARLRENSGVRRERLRVATIWPLSTHSQKESRDLPAILAVGFYYSQENLDVNWFSNDGSCA